MANTPATAAWLSELAMLSASPASWAASCTAIGIETCPPPLQLSELATYLKGAGLGVPRAHVADMQPQAPRQGQLQPDIHMCAAQGSPQQTPRCCSDCNCSVASAPGGLHAAV